MASSERDMATVQAQATSKLKVQLQAAGSCWKASDGHRMTVWRVECGGVVLPGSVRLCSVCGAFGGFHEDARRQGESCPSCGADEASGCYCGMEATR